jgi:hypothetical protein
MRVGTPWCSLLDVGQRSLSREVGPVCLSCHDFKDRVLLADWPVASVVEIIRGCTTPDARIFPAKAYALLLDSDRSPQSHEPTTAT